MLMLAAARGLVASDAAVRASEFTLREKQQSVELHGRTLLVVGLERIGCEVAVRAAAFGMRVTGFDPYLPDDSSLTGMERRADLDAALAEAQVVTLHLPRTDATRGLFDRARLARLPKGAILLNTARCGIVDEAALAEALRMGQLHAAATDVFEHEPLVPADPLLRARNLTVTPHDAAMTREGARRMAVLAARNIFDFLGGRLGSAMPVNGAAPVA